MGEAKKILLLPPPPTESARLTAIPENLLLLPPPPTESARLTAIPENFCYYPPPHRMWSASGDHGKLAPPKQKSWLRRCCCGAHIWFTTGTKESPTLADRFFFFFFVLKLALHGRSIISWKLCVSPIINRWRHICV